MAYFESSYSSCTVSEFILVLIYVIAATNTHSHFLQSLRVAPPTERRYHYGNQEGEQLPNGEWWKCEHHFAMETPAIKKTSYINFSKSCDHYGDCPAVTIETRS